MATPIVPSEPSTQATVNDPNSVTNITKITEQIKKQANSDTKYDTKGKLYDGFQDLPTGQKAFSILLSFLLTAGTLLVVGAILPKRGR